jgi:hypothetical protein
MFYKLLEKGHWKNWLERPIAYAYMEEDVCDDSNELELITIVDWVGTITKRYLISKLEKNGYLIAGSHTQFISSILNYIYRFEYNYQFNQVTTSIYLGPNGRKMSYTNEDIDYFITYKFPEQFWKNMKDMFEIPFYADDGDFAYRLWLDLPYFIFSCLNIKESTATLELQEQLTCEEETSEEKPDTRKKDIDPYLLDYGGYKYKNYDIT